jgi:hypothetical protein
MPLVPLAVLVGCGASVIEGWLAGPAWFAAPAVCGVVILPGVLGTMEVNLGSDRRGLAFARDLIGWTPDDALVLLTGDLYVQSATYVCSVERSCGRRVLLMPGTLRAEWQRTEVARENSELAEELGPAPAIASSHVIIAKEIQRRPVYVMTDFLVKDPALKEYPFAPDVLLVRLYAGEAAAQADLPRIRARLEALAAGGDCDGCSMFRHDGAEQEDESLLRQAYASALSNAATSAKALVGDDALAARLQARADELAPARRAE